MTNITKGFTVTNVKSIFRVLCPGLNVVSVKRSPNLPAILASEFISCEHARPPSFYSVLKTCPLSLCHTTLPKGAFFTSPCLGIVGRKTFRATRFIGLAFHDLIIGATNNTRPCVLVVGPPSKMVAIRRAILCVFAGWRSVKGIITNKARVVTHRANYTTCTAIKTISQEYVDLAKRRIAAAPVPLPLVVESEPVVKAEQLSLVRCD